MLVQEPGRVTGAQLNGLADHEYLAIQAGVEIGAVTVLGIEQDVFVFIDDVDDVQLDAELLGHPQRVVAFGLGPVFFANCVGVALDAEAGKKINAFHGDALIQNDLSGQHGIEST